MKMFAAAAVGALLFVGCSAPDEPQAPTGLFSEVAPAETSGLVLPEGFSYDLLFKAGTDTVVTASGAKAPAREKADFIGYLPIDGSSDHGYLYVSHETRNPDSLLGDGAGATFFEVQRTNGRWQVLGDFKHVRFDGVGGTLRNCGGVVTPHNTVLVAEECEPSSNASLMAGYGITDTSDYNGLKRYLNMGWMVEVDPFTQQALGKIYRMGRFEHEDAHCMADGVTVYLTDDHDPAVFFKFVADKPGRYSQGQLYAYKQAENGTGGEWLTLPMQIDSLLDIRNVAMRMGATIFVRHEWIDAGSTDSKLIIAETGNDVLTWQRYMDMGAAPANYFAALASSETAGTYNDPFGRILEFDTETNTMRVLLEGGPTADGQKHFSSPDGLSTAAIGGKRYAILSEDLIGLSKGRVSAAAEAKGAYYNEVYLLDLSKPSPTVADLMRFCTAPLNCETTGSMVTPDGSTCFLSIQHPDASNPAPFNTTCVIAIQGFAGSATASTEAKPES